MSEANLNPATIDFTSLREQAMAHPAGNDDVTAAPSSEPAPAPDVVSSVPAPAEAPAPTLSPAELKVLELPDDAFNTNMTQRFGERLGPMHLSSTRHALGTPPATSYAGSTLPSSSAPMLSALPGTK